MATIDSARATMRTRHATTNTIESRRPELTREQQEPSDRDPVVAKHRRDVAFTQEDLKNVELMEKEVGTSYLTALRDKLNAQLKEQRVVFDKWAKVLARPAYSDQLGDLNAWFKDKARIDRVEAATPAPSTLGQTVRRQVGRLFNIAPVVLVPAEAFFAYPAFQFLTPKDHWASMAGALIFTSLLGLLGHASAMFLLRGAINEVDDDERSIRTVIRPFALSMTVALTFCALFMSYAGADLRSKLPDIALLNERIAQYEGDREGVLRQAINDTELSRQTEITRERQRLDKEWQDIGQRRAEINRIDYSLRTSDKLVALFVYFTMFLAAAGRVILSRDPVFEYQLATDSVRELEGWLSRIGAVQEENRLYWRREVHARRTLLASFRAELGKIAPKDPLALPEPNAKSSDVSVASNDDKYSDGANSKSSAEAKKSEGDSREAADAKDDKESDFAAKQDDKTDNPAVLTFERLSRAWRQERLQRYTQWYGWFSWHGLDTYDDSRRKALARESVRA